jgi:hypothetical protein
MTTVPSKVISRLRPIATAVLVLTTAVEAGAFGLLFGDIAGFDSAVTAGAFYSSAGLVAGALVAWTLGAWWVRSLRSAPFHQALLLGVVIHVPCGLVAIALSTSVLGLTKGFWSAVMSMLFAFGVGLPFVIGGGLAAGTAFYLLTERS